MSQFPAVDAIRNAATNAAQKDNFAAFLDATKELIGAQAETTITIASGVATPAVRNGGAHLIDTEGAAPADDLTNLATTNTPAGRWLLIRGANASRAVTVKHLAGGSGEISLRDGVDYLLDNAAKFLLLQLRGTTWTEILRNDAAGGEGRFGNLVVYTLDGGGSPAVLDLAGNQGNATRYTPPATLKWARIRGAGGGGAGGGAAATSGSESSAGAGGAGGRCAEGVLTRDQITAAFEAAETWIDVTVGAAGAPAAGAAGGNGGASSFGSLITLGGGNGGETTGALTTIQVAAGGSEGTIAGTGYQIALGSERGEDGIQFGNGVVVNTVGRGGRGGSTAFGSGGGGRSARLNGSNGIAGIGYGGGGGGAANGNSQAARTGGAGRSGVWIIEEFYA